MMKNKWLKGGIILGTMLLAMSISSAAQASDAEAASYDVKLVIDGKAVTTNKDIGQPYITKGGRTMLPLRLIGEQFDSTVSYVNGTIYLSNPLANFSAWFNLGDSRFVVNYQAHQSDAVPVLSAEDRTYLPARAIAEAFGKVAWEPSTRTVSITNALPAKRKAQEFPISDQLSYRLSYGYTGATATNIGLERYNPSKRVAGLLAFPANEAKHYQESTLDRLMLHSVKLTPNGGALAAVISPRSQVRDYSMDVFYDDMKSDALRYAGAVVRSSDYTSDGHYLFSTEGLLDDGFGIDRQRLYIKGIDNEQFAFIKLDFPVNEAALKVEEAYLVATEPNGQIHRLPIKALLQQADFVQ